MLRHLVLALLMLLVLPVTLSARANVPTLSPADTRIEINIPEYMLRVYRGETVVRVFPVGVGRAGYPTPVGEYRIINRLENPTWENPYLNEGAVRIRPGSENPLGTRWMGFYNDGKGEYGIHGTDSPTTVGKASSHGCIRMKIKDAEALYGLISMGTPVSVTYQLFRLERKGWTVVMRTFPDLYRRGKPDVRLIERQVRTQFPETALMPDALRSALQNPALEGRVIGFTGHFRAPDP